MKNLFLILLLSVFCFSCLQRKGAITDNNFQKPNGLYLYLDTLENAIPFDRNEVINDFGFIFIKTDLNDTLFLFSYCSSNFPNKQETILGYKGVIKVKNINIFIFDKDEIGIKFYGDSLQIAALPEFKKFENAQGCVYGYLKNNIFKHDMHYSEIYERGWRKYYYQ